MNILITILIFLSINTENNSQEIGKKLIKFIRKTYRLEYFNVIPCKQPDTGNGKFYFVVSQNDTTGIIYSGRVNTCRAGGCSIIKTVSDNNFEYFRYIIAFDKNINIKKIKIYDYQATHGQEITAASWLKQFCNNNENKFVVNKNIDTISGATISVYAIVDDVNYILATAKDYFLKKQK